MKHASVYWISWLFVRCFVFDRFQLLTQRKVWILVFFWSSLKGEVLDRSCLLIINFLDKHVSVIHCPSHISSGGMFNWTLMHCFSSQVIFLYTRLARNSKRTIRGFSTYVKNSEKLLLIWVDWNGKYILKCGKTVVSVHCTDTFSSRTWGLFNLEYYRKWKFMHVHKHISHVSTLNLTENWGNY